MITYDTLHTKGEEFKLGYYAAMNEKHGDGDFVVVTPDGAYQRFQDFGAAIRSMTPISRMFVPFVDGPVSLVATKSTDSSRKKKS